MNPSDHLTPEERDLARLLGRPGARVAGPSARVDADILTLARAPAPASPVASAAPAAATTSSLPSSTHGRGWNRRRRLTSSLAIAASLVLVVGLAWQLQPSGPQLPPPAGDAAQAAVAADAAPAAADAAADTAHAETEAANAGPAPAPAAQRVEPIASPQTRQLAPAASAPQELLPAQPAADDAENMASSAAPYAAAEMAAPPAPAPPAPAPVAPSVITVPPQPTQNSGETSDAPLRLRAPRPQFEGPRIIPHAGEKAMEKASAARQLRSAPMPAAASVAAASVDIEADTTLSRRQWLKRIRERLESGDQDGARASLRRFAHDYPEARVPKDLQPLLKD
ncbi:MAG: hypothetical protein ACN6O2_12595 [Stenotrophomonas sp.]